MLVDQFLIDVGKPTPPRTLSKLLERDMGFFFKLSVLIVSVVSDDAELLRSFLVGVAKSIEKSEFRCRFEFERGLAVSREDALAGNFVNFDANGALDPTGALEKDGGSGVMVKLDDHLRYIYNSWLPTDVKSGGGGASRVSNDVTFYNDMLVNYTPRQINLENKYVGGNLIISMLEKGNGWPVLGQSGSLFADFAPIFSIEHAMARAESLAKVNNDPNRQNRILLERGPASEYEFRFTRGEGGALAGTIVMQLTTEYPQILEFRTKSTTIQMQDHINVGQAIVPTTCRRAVGPVKIAGSDKDYWVGSIWQGSEFVEPTKQDFELKIDTGKDKVVGYELPDGADSINILDLDPVFLRNRDESAGLGPILVQPTAENATFSLPSVVVPVAVSLILILIVWTGVRQWNNRD